jgi:hypothetical protein
MWNPENLLDILQIEFENEGVFCSAKCQMLFKKQGGE